MDEADRELLIRVDENVSHLKQNFPPLVKKVGELERFRTRQETHNKWIKGVLSAFGAVFLAAISGLVVMWWKT